MQRLAYPRITIQDCSKAEEGWRGSFFTKQKCYVHCQTQIQGNPTGSRPAVVPQEWLAGFPRDENAELRSAHPEPLALFT